MRKSIIEPANALKEKLFEIPAIVSAFSRKDNDVCQNWISWLEHVEEIFKKYNYAQCAEIAGYRALLLSKTINTGNEKRSQKRKMQLQTAISSIQPVQQLVSDKNEELHNKIEQVRLLLRQILIPAKDAGMINYNVKSDFTAFIESLLLQFKKHEQIGHGINNAIATIGKYDVLRILAEEIEI